MAPPTNPHEGRFTVEEAFDYEMVRQTIPGFAGDVPAFGILDNESGHFIAFSKNEEGAERVCKALRILAEYSEKRDIGQLYRFAISERQQADPTNTYESAWIKYLDAIIAFTNPYTAVQVPEEEKAPKRRFWNGFRISREKE